MKLIGKLSNGFDMKRRNDKRRNKEMELDNKS